MKRPLYAKKVFSLTKSNSESLQKTGATDQYSWNGPPECAPEKWSRFFKLPEPLGKKCILMLWERLLEGKHLSVGEKRTGQRAQVLVFLLDCSGVYST